MFRPLLLLLMYWLCQPPAFAQRPFTINGRITGLQDSAVIWLMINNGTVLSTVATDTILNGVFTFTVTPEKEGVTRYALRGHGDNFPSSWLDVWVKPGLTIHVTGNGYLFKNWAVKSDIAEQKEAARYFAPSAQDWKRWQELIVERKQLPKKYPGAGKEILNAASDSLNRLSGELQNKIADTELATMQRMPVTDMWMEKLKQAASSTGYNPREAYRQKVIALYNGLPEQHRKSRAGVETRTFLWPPVVVKKGEPMADTTMVDLQGKIHRLSDYKGRYLMLDFWSVGCGPCIAAMPELDSIAVMEPARLQVVSINIDEKQAMWRKFMEKRTPAGLNLNDDWGMTGLAARYGVNGIPHYVMISPEGVVVDHWIGYTKNDLIKRVQALLP